MRFLLRHARSGEWLNHEGIPISDDGVTWGLGTANLLTGTITPQVAGARKADGTPLIAPWETEVLVVEDSGLLSWRGHVHDCPATGAGMRLTVKGVASFLDGLPYTGRLIKERKIDPADAYRRIWSYVQAHNGADLGLRVDDTTTPIRIATETRAVEFDANDEPVAFEASEWWELAWWEAPDLGQEASSLADEGSFEVREEHKWAVRGESVDSFLRIGYPRLGRRRGDLRFVEGENISRIVTVERTGDDFATGVLVLGAGEGSRRVTAHANVAAPSALRRIKVIEDPNIKRKGHAQRVADRAVAFYSVPTAVEQITVSGAVPVQPGDDILVQARSGWLGTIKQWSRVESITRSNGSHETTLGLSRSGAWRYG